MQRPLRLLCAILLTTCFSAPAAAERLGLVVGIDKYDSLAPLKNAVADADAIAATLRTTGFTVPKEWVLKNPGKREMDDAINALAGSTKPGDEVFLYFSGHGVQIGATPLMMPADVRDPVRRANGQMRSHENNRDVYEATEQVKSDGISLQAVANKIAERGPRLSLLVIDACRDNPVIDLLREAQRYGKNMGGGATTGFDAIEKGENQIVIFAAGKGERALDRLGGADTERNSVFARVLLKKMRTPGLELRKLYGEVKDEVPRLASQYKDPATGAPHRQKPVALAGYGVPDFYFIQVPVNVTVNQGTTDPLAVELAFWNSVKDSGSAGELKLYLERYPQGQFAALARGRAKSLEAVATPPATAAAPVAVWSAPSISAGQIIKDCAECPELVVIPGGSFEMGSNDYDSEKPVHTVRVKAFALGKTEVTQGQWKALMGSNPSNFSQCGDDCPVESVTWHEAQEYVQKLTQKTGKSYRLPSEAEWEYACLAGEQHTYCGSNEIGSVAWYGYETQVGNSAKTINRVAGKQANAWGLYDMSGNVWEWVEDCANANYNGAPTDGSAWASGTCTQRVLRGGSWYHGPENSRAATRYTNDSTNRYGSKGFRLARMLP